VSRLRLRDRKQPRLADVERLQHVQFSFNQHVVNADCIPPAQAEREVVTHSNNACRKMLGGLRSPLLIADLLQRANLPDHRVEIGCLDRIASRYRSG